LAILIIVKQKTKNPKRREVTKMTGRKITISNTTVDPMGEVEILQKLQEGFQGSGTCLETLFTPEFTKWASSRIGGCEPIDILEELQEAQRKIQALQRDLKKMVENLEKAELALFGPELKMRLDQMRGKQEKK
jgi:hypothetical protein